MKARFLCTLHGQKVYRFPVEVTFGQEAALHQVNHYPKGVVEVIARNAREAVDNVAEPIRHIPCVEVTAFGPKGGIAAHRYWGWDTALFLQMCRRDDGRQLYLFKRNLTS